MGFHTFDADEAARLEDESRYRYLSRDELVAALDPSPDDVVVDLGSGTGFYTDDVAPHVARVVGVDVQPSMHRSYRSKGVPENVELVTAAVEAVPAVGAFDGAVSTMTFHEFASPDALSSVAAALEAGARFVVVDWSARGEGERGPQLDHRYAVEEAADRLADVGFTVDAATERPETFLAVAVAP